MNDRKRAIEDITIDGKDLSEFYSKLRKIKEFHQKIPDQALVMHLELDVLKKTKEQVVNGIKSYCYHCDLHPPVFFSAKA